MSSETIMMAEQCHLREWAAQIRDCQSRPAQERKIRCQLSVHPLVEAYFMFPWSPNLPANFRKPPVKQK